jgi:hypothetical protein
VKRDGLDHARHVVDTCDDPNGLCEGTWDCRTVRVILDEAKAQGDVLETVVDALDDLVATVGLRESGTIGKPELDDSMDKAVVAMESWLRWRRG